MRQSVSLKHVTKITVCSRTLGGRRSLQEQTFGSFSATATRRDRVAALWVLYVADVRARVDQLDGVAGDESGHLPYDGGRRRSVLSAANEEHWVGTDQMAL